MCGVCGYMDMWDMRPYGLIAAPVLWGTTTDSRCWTYNDAWLQGKPVAKRVIVVTPSTLTQNWAAEVQKWLGSERCKTLVMQPGPGAESQVGFVCHDSHVL